jgi:hypothetical protein
MAMADEGFLDIEGARLEYRMIGPRPDAAPTIVMLHEGLGSAALWGDFPERLARRTKAGVFVYSRAGYGRSSPVALPRPLDYMQREATEVLPKLLDAIGFRRGVLVGHSDGASNRTSSSSPSRCARSRAPRSATPRASCATSSPATMPMSTSPSGAGTRPGSTPASPMFSTSSSRSPTSACRS